LISTTSPSMADMHAILHDNLQILSVVAICQFHDVDIKIKKYWKITKL